MFVGYHREQPFLLQTAFSVLSGYLQPPQLTQLVEAPNDFCIASGSQVVWDELKQEVCKPETLAEGVILVQEYVNRCIKNDTDPYCANIGGRVQVATITNSGFSWVTPP